MHVVGWKFQNLYRRHPVESRKARWIETANVHFSEVRGCDSVSSVSFEEKAESQAFEPETEGGKVCSMTER